jgi:hypothetical protein
MVIKRVGALSLAKIAAVLYGGIGLLVGGAFALIGMAGIASRFGSDNPGASFIGPLFGVGAIIIVPICYAIGGFVVALIMAGIFNLAAGITGGVEIDVQ